MNERENEGCRKAAASDGGDAQDRSLSAQIAAQEPFERRPVLDTGDLEVAVPVARTRTMPFSSLTSTPSLAAKSGTPRKSAVALGGTMLNTSPPWNSAICSPASM